MFNEYLAQVIECIVESGKTEEEAETLVAAMFDNCLSDPTMVSLLFRTPLPPRLLS